MRFVRITPRRFAVRSSHERLAPRTKLVASSSSPHALGALVAYGLTAGF
jgi:hypothetical protein